MEKKGIRLVQPLSSKGPGTDSKKSQDVSKQWPRGGRRREPNNGAFPKPCEVARKPVPQRGKNLDKRPRPRGFYNAGAVGGKEESGLEPELEAELGSVFLQGSKKQSLNHLLNFHFEPRDSLGHSHPVKGGYRWNAITKHKYNKEQFLQANCQFVVQESGDYRAYMNNPDALVDWSLIVQVNLQVLEFPSCPICLYPPVAAKMTRCGHIYCWSCLLHYLALSDKTWRKCPICFEAVHKDDLKSVFTEPHTPFNTSEDITFKLMKRYKGSLISYPADYPVHEDVILNMSDENTANIYSKLLLAGKSEIASIIERERVQLLTQLSEDEHCPERCFIEQALALLHERETGIQNVGNIEKVTEELNGNKMVLLDESDITSTKCHYFYQASDGQHIYLHPLNVRMVEHTYGSLEYCPRTITGCILEKEAASITDDLRKRLRYLQHLPVTCTFEVAEIIITPPLISQDTFSYFQEQIETRCRRRQRRARDEKRREKKITEEENKKIGRYPIPNIKLESPYQFPDFQVSAVGSVENETPSTSETPTPSSSVAGSLNADNEYAGLSFAKMLAANKTSASPVWPIRKTTSDKPIVINSNNAKPQINSAANFEDYESAPAFNHSFGDAIALALEKVTVTESDGQEKSSGKRKKKKKEKKVLFATSMAYSTR